MTKFQVYTRGGMRLSLRSDTVDWSCLHQKKEALVYIFGKSISGLTHSKSLTPNQLYCNNIGSKFRHSLCRVSKHVGQTGLMVCATEALRRLLARFTRDRTGSIAVNFSLM